MDVINTMKKTLTFKCLALGVLVAMLLCSCSGAWDYTYEFSYEDPKIISTVNVSDGTAETNKEYASNDNFTLYVDEVNATFKIVDKNNAENVWSSAPLTYSYKTGALAQDYKSDDTKALIRVRYSHQIGPSETILNSYTNSVLVGKTDVHQLENGVRFDFRFDMADFLVPVQVLLHPQGVEISVLNKYLEEPTEGYNITSVDVAPYFMASTDSSSEGYFVIPDGEGALVDWNNVPNTSVTYRNFVYGRDNAITIYEQNGLTQDIRLPVFGAQFKATETVEKPMAPGAEGEPETTTFDYARKGYTAVITEGAARAALNFDLSKDYNIAYSEFIYRDIAKVKADNTSELQSFVERSKTTIPVQTTRYILSVDEELDYVDMAETYRNYLLDEAGVTKSTKEGSAPMVVELFGGMMKQQFVLGFPVDKVVPMTTYDDAGEVVKALKKAGVSEIVLNYTQWQKDGTGAAIQTSVKAEGELGGKKALNKFLELCKSENISVYLNMNTNVMAKSAMGYNTSNDSTSTVRWDPAVQYYYEPNTGLPRMNAPTFLLAPTKLMDTTVKLAGSAEKLNITGVSSTILGSELYSDFAKRPTTRDVSEYLWNDALKELAKVKGNLLLTSANAYALDEATFITDVPMGCSDFQSITTAIPFYQIVLHGITPMSTPAINGSDDVQEAFLWAIETGSYLKWNWTARNQDELVESIFNHMTSSDYTSWIETATDQYKQAQELLGQIATYTVTEHKRIGDVVRVLWTDGTNEVEVYVNYGDTEVQIDNVTVGGRNFTVCRNR